MNYTRDLLYRRHRLSHQQINNFLGEQQNQLVFEEKLNQLSMLAGFLEITDKFIQDNIWFVPLKGPLLSYRIYGDATCRIYRDFDFLIKPAEVFTVIQIFRDLGFEYDKKKWPESQKSKQRITSRINQLTLYNLEKQQTVEIHWRVFIDPIADFDQISDVVAENIQQIEFAGRQLNRFTLEFELLYLIIHGGLHTWRRLKWLVDIHEIVSRFNVDKEKFINLVNFLNAQRLVGLCNAMLRHFFPGTTLLPVDYPVPQWFFHYALQQVKRESDSTNYGLGNIFKLRWYYIQAFPGYKYKQKRILIHFITMRKLNPIDIHFF